MEIEEILKQCTIDDKVVRLPDIQLDRKTYCDVAKRLELIGGKWNRKFKGFLFENDPTELLADVQNGEKRNLKKEFQFFETPAELAEKLVSYIEEFVDTKEMTILEPSAGRGSIVRAINKMQPDAKVFHCELMELNRKMFQGDSEFLQEDFLTLDENKKFDFIIANPPFNKNQDIEHFMKMTKHTSGRIVSIMSCHWKFSKNKKETEFREFLQSKAAQIIDIDAGAFKESGTNIPTCIVILDNN